MFSSVRSVWLVNHLLLVLLLALGCSSKSSDSSSSAQTSADKKTRKTTESSDPQPQTEPHVAGAAESPLPTRPEPVKPNLEAPVQTRDGEECRSMFNQTGQGCNMEGIVAAISPERRPGGGIQRCYLQHVSPPRQVHLKLGFALSPEGKAKSFRWMEDAGNNDAFNQCLISVFEKIQYPAPGDVPCQVVYPLSFVPEVRR